MPDLPVFLFPLSSLRKGEANFKHPSFKNKKGKYYLPLPMIIQAIAPKRPEIAFSLRYCSIFHTFP